MNAKKWLIASVVVFIVVFACDWLFNNVCLKSDYEATANLWRPMDEMMKNMWMWVISAIIWSLLFCFIYTKGYEGKGNGAAEGLRYGFWIGLFVTIPMSIGMYFSMPIPKSLDILVRHGDVRVPPERADCWSHLQEGRSGCVSWLKASIFSYPVPRALHGAQAQCFCASS